VADALPADVLLVPADGVPYGLYAVRVADAGVGLAPVVSLDQTRQLCDITLDGAQARRVASGRAANAAVDAALLAGAGVLASEQFGLAERALEITVAYVQERRQFARPVGGFQAIKHRLAELWVAVTQARAAARFAANGLVNDNGTETELAVALAKAACSDTALKAAQEMIQLHGGIGFTWEHPAHLFLKRAKADSIGFGTADAHRASLAGLVNLPPPPAR
jgi:alkylation response protein AidB-like acyl-CoA dehydrogenase